MDNMYVKALPLLKQTIAILAYWKVQLRFRFFCHLVNPYILFKIRYICCTLCSILIYDNQELQGVDNKVETVSWNLWGGGACIIHITIPQPEPPPPYLWVFFFLNVYHSRNEWENTVAWYYNTLDYFFYLNTTPLLPELLKLLSIKTLIVTNSYLTLNQMLLEQ